MEDSNFFIKESSESKLENPKLISSVEEGESTTAKFNKPLDKETDNEEENTDNNVDIINDKEDTLKQILHIEAVHTARKKERLKMQSLAKKHKRWLVNPMWKFWMI